MRFLAVCLIFCLCASAQSQPGFAFDYAFDTERFGVVATVDVKKFGVWAGYSIDTKRVKFEDSFSYEFGLRYFIADHLAVTAIDTTDLSVTNPIPVFSLQDLSHP
jgi:hypothetical protein